MPGDTNSTTNTDIATFNSAISSYTWGNSAANPVVINSSTQNIGGINFTGATGNFYIGSTGGNALMVSSGGSIQMLSGLTATNALVTVNAPLSIQSTNGTYTLANNSASGTGAGAGTMHFGGTISGAASGNTTLTLSGSNTNLNTISGSIVNGASTMSVVKTGTGVWQLSGTHTYSGTTQINGGILTLSSGALLSNTSVIVGGAASTGSPTLAGAGTIGGNVTISSANGGAAGIHSPGYNSVATQTINGTVTYQSGSKFNWDIMDGLASSVGLNSGSYDQVVAGSLAGTNSIFQIYNSSNFTSTFWDTNRSWDNIFTASGSTMQSVFTSFGGNVPSTGIVNGQGTFSIVGNTLYWTAVPEPDSAMLCALFISASMLRRKRSMSEL